jgi:hypothetical protein|nr:MAG TPA: hypothetical protein [Caudoviricetes sp.]
MKRLLKEPLGKLLLIDLILSIYLIILPFLPNKAPTPNKEKPKKNIRYQDKSKISDTVKVIDTYIYLNSDSIKDRYIRIKSDTILIFK